MIYSKKYILSHLLMKCSLKVWCIISIFVPLILQRFSFKCVVLLIQSQKEWYYYMHDKKLMNVYTNNSYIFKPWKDTKGTQDICRIPGKKW
jgi:hypothetical protein